MSCNLPDTSSTLTPPLAAATGTGITPFATILLDCGARAAGSECWVWTDGKNEGIDETDDSMGGSRARLEITWVSRGDVRWVREGSLITGRGGYKMGKLYV